jgi:CBS domain-containing protein
MLNQQLISPQITPLHPDESVGNALLRMEELGIGHLPVIRDGQFEGLLAEEDLLDANEDDLVEALRFQWQPFHVPGDEHYYSAARLLVSRKLTLVPVVTAEKEYLGCIESEALLRQTARQLGVLEGGAIMMLDMEPQQYSIGELSKLVETNDAQITQLNTIIDELTGHLIVTMRLNKQEVSDVVATFQRYDYQVIYFAGEEHYENELRRNYNHLMNFLTM